MRMIPVIRGLAWREVLRFLRQPSRVVGSLGQPLLFWVILGAGLTPTFTAPGLEGITYMQYFFPGVLVMMMLFASIFSSITVIEDRDQGFLQGVVVAPVPRLAIVLGKVKGGVAIAFLQCVVLMLGAPLVGLMPSPLGLLLVLVGLVLGAWGFASLGFAVAWSMRSTSGFHAIMMVVLMPLWLLSGALFPLNTAPPVLQALMWINPVSHALALLQLPLLHGGAEALTEGRYWLGLAVTALWIGLCLWWGAARVRKVARGV